MKLEQIKTNAELMKSNGLEKEVVEIAKRVYNETLEKVRGYHGVKTHICDASLIAETLSIFGDSIKGLKILDLGCGTSSFGRGDYSPVLSTAFASLGANVTGVDFSNDSEEIKKKVLEKYGFNYVKCNFALWGFDQYISEEDKTRASNNDLIILHSLLHKDLMRDDTCNGIYYRLDEEWSQYNRIVSNLRKLNRNSLWILQIPEPKHFPFETQEIKEEKELNDYAVKRFKECFGKPIFGKEFSGNHVFVNL
jgi:SAM-dependent methyltransferase